MEAKLKHPKAESILSFAPVVQNLFYALGRGYSIPEDLRKKLGIDPREGKPTYMLPSFQASSKEIVKNEGLAQKVDEFLEQYSKLHIEIGSATIKAEEQAKRELAESVYNLSMLNAFPIEGGRELMVDLMSSVVKPDDPRVLGRAEELTKKFKGEYYKMPELKVTNTEQDILRGSISDELAKGLIHVEFVPRDTLLAQTNLILEEILKDQPQIKGAELEEAKRRYEYVKNPENRLKIIQEGTSKDIKAGIDEVYESNNNRFVVDYSILSNHSMFSGGAFRRAWEHWSNDLQLVGFDIHTKTHQ